MDPYTIRLTSWRSSLRLKYCDLRHSYIPAILSLVAICLLLTSLLLVFVAPVAAQIDADEIESIARDPKVPWQLEADQVEYDQSADEYTATGNVLIYKENIKLSADFVRFDHKNMMAYAEGSVVLTDGSDILKGDRMEVDLEQQIGTIDNGYLFLKENNYHITGDVIKKVGPKTYTLDKAIITTCDGDNPDWRVTGRNVKIKDDGEATAKHAAIWARKMPVIYTPYFYYPARKDRQTGFLWPDAGASGRWGYYYNQPFFWAIDESSDATFYGHYMGERGFRAGAEYRYYLDEWSKGTWMVDGFSDRKIDDGTGSNSQDWGFPDGGKKILRENKERYWLRASHHQKMPWDVRARLDLDIVSDQDYTREFRTGPISWKQSKEYFEEVFGRDLDDHNEPVRTSQLNFNKLWPTYSLNAKLSYNLDSTVRNTGEPDTTLQQLPLIEFDGVKQRIGSSSFFYNLNTEYIYHWSREDKRGQRADLYPRFYWPIQVKPFFTIEPSFGVRETMWYLDKQEYGPEDQNFYHRELYDTRINLFTDFFRVFDLGGTTFKALKHSMRPEISHTFIPDVDQTDLPDFDNIDRIDKRNEITYSLTNTLTTKSRKTGSFEFNRRVDLNEAAIIDSPTDHAYNDFLRFKLEQSFDINEARESDPYRPFSPLFAELDVFPGKYFALDADANWSVYDLEILSNNVAANFWDERGDRLTIEYRYTKESDETDFNETNSINGALRVKLTDRLTVRANYEYNFLEDVQVEAGAGFLYRSQCWALDAEVRETTGVDEEKQYAFEFKVDLFGLGELEF